MTQSIMPALFIGHGSPMNALEDNRYTQAWRQLAASISKPKAILVVSAHWYTRGTAVTAMQQPKTIHDFGGFPQSLFDVQYPAAGDMALAVEIQQLLEPTKVVLDSSQWGLDHGSWEILLQMYPQADIPVLQLSLDGTQSPHYHYQLGQKLARLRKEGVLIIGSGNVVHNLRMIRWQDSATAYDWAQRFNQFVSDNLHYQGNVELHPLVNYATHPDAQLAHPSPEHYLPLLYILAMWDQKEALTIPVDGIEMGSLSMMCVRVG